MEDGWKGQEQGQEQEQEQQEEQESSEGEEAARQSHEEHMRQLAGMARSPSQSTLGPEISRHHKAIASI